MSIASASAATLTALGALLDGSAPPRELAPRSRPRSAVCLIFEPVRTIEVAYFLRYCLLTCTDAPSG
jgi:hypothetical protein